MASKEAAPDKERPGSHALDALETSGDVPELLEKPERPVAPDDVSGAVDVESGRLEPAQPQPQHDQNIVSPVQMPFRLYLVDSTSACPIAVRNPSHWF